MAKMMTRRARDFEAKLKVATAELKESNKIQTQLLQERDESEAEMLAILGQNSTLKKQLAELLSQYEDTRSEMECLQSRLECVNQCHETYELAMQKISDQKQELYECSVKIELYESSLAKHYHSSLDLRTELENDDPSMSLLDYKCTTPKCSGDYVIQGSNKIKKYVKLSNFIKKSEKKLKKHKNVFTKARLCKEKSELNKELKSCYKLLGQNSIQQDSMSEKIVCLEKSLHDLTEKYTQSENDFAEINAILSDETVYVQVCNSSSQTDQSTYEQLSSSTSLQGGAACAGLIAAQPVPAPQPLVKPHASSCNKKTVMYSDQIGMGMGMLLRDQLQQEVINNCTPNAPINYFINRIKNDNCFNNNTTLIVQLGESRGVKRLDVIQLVETLLGKLEQGLGKLILCAFPYSNTLSTQENKHIFNMNLILYNLTSRHSDILYFETNNFISNFILTKSLVHLSRRSKLIIAKLLAFNIFDTVIGIITQSTDKPVVSSSTNEGLLVTGPIARHLN